MSKDKKDAKRGFPPYFWRGPDIEEEPPGLPNEIKPLPPIIHALHINLPGLRICYRDLKTKAINMHALPEFPTFTRPTLHTSPDDKSDQKDVLDSLGVSLGMSAQPRNPATPPRRNFPAREGRCSVEPFVPAPAASRTWSDSLMIYERVVWIRPEVPCRKEPSDAQSIPTPPQKPLETPRFPWFQTMRDSFRNMVTDWFQVRGSQEERVPEYQDQEFQTILRQSSSTRQLPPVPLPVPLDDPQKTKRRLPLLPDGTLGPDPRSSSVRRKLPVPIGPPYQGPLNVGSLYEHPKQETLRPEDEERLLKEHHDSLPVVEFLSQSTPTPQDFQIHGPSRPQIGRSGLPGPETSEPEGHIDPRFIPGPPRQQIPLAFLQPIIYLASPSLRESLHQNQWRNIRHEAPHPQRRMLPDIRPPYLRPPSEYSVAQSETSSEYSDYSPMEYSPPAYDYSSESSYPQYYTPTLSSGGGHYEDPGPRWTPSPWYSHYHHPRHYRSSSVGYEDYGRGRGGTPESQQLPSEYESPTPSYYQNEQSLSARSPALMPQGFRRGHLQRQENVDVPTTSSDLSAPASEVGRDSQGRHSRDSASSRSPDYWPGRRY